MGYGGNIWEHPVSARNPFPKLELAFSMDPAANSIKIKINVLNSPHIDFKNAETAGR